MPEDMNQEHVLAILYDMALTIGASERLDPLLRNTLQKLMFHTGYPCGLIFLNRGWIQNGSSKNNGDFPDYLAYAIGDHKLISHVGYTIPVPENLKKSKADDKKAEDEFINCIPLNREYYKHFIRFHVPDIGLIILCSPTKQKAPYPFDEMFKPIMSNLSRALRLCRMNEKNLSDLISDRDAARSDLQRFRSALDNIDDIVILVDSETHFIVDFNKSAVNQLGFSTEELHSMTLEDVFIGEVIDNCKVYIKKITQGIETNASFDATQRDKSGNEVPVEIRLSIFRQENVVPIIIAVIRDISERKKSEEMLQKLNQSLEERVEYEVEARRKKEEQLIQQSRVAQMGEMVKTIAHHWRQPLNTLALIIQDLGEAYDYGELDKEYMLVGVKSAMSVLEELSDTISEFRHFVSDKTESVYFNIQDMIGWVIKLIEPDLKEDEIKVDLSRVQPIKIFGNKNLYARLIHILLTNSRESLEKVNERPREIRIHTSVDSSGNIFLTVTDNGEGIEPAIIDRIFDPFFSTKGSTINTGTGLYFAKMMIEEELKGTITAEPLTQGVSFTIKIPEFITHSDKHTI